MRISVCGLGNVGKPLIDSFRNFGVEAIGYDIDEQKTEASVADCVNQSDGAIFIVPTPSLPSGAFSNTFLVDALAAFRDEVTRQQKTDYLYIVSSTTTPGSCEMFRKIVGSNLCYKPEFIRLAHVREDIIAPYFVLIGSDSESAAERCAELYRTFGTFPIKHMTLLEAELAKITLNCALTMKVSLANQLYLVAEKMGADSSVIMDAVGSDPRIGRAYLQPGWPFGGPCLPRDNRMFQYVALNHGVHACLSEAADKINSQIKGPEQDGWKADVRDYAHQSSA